MRQGQNNATGAEQRDRGRTMRQGQNNATGAEQRDRGRTTRQGQNNSCILERTNHKERESELLQSKAMQSVQIECAAMDTSVIQATQRTQLDQNRCECINTYPWFILGNASVCYYYYPILIHSLPTCIIRFSPNSKTKLSWNITKQNKIELSKP